MHTAHQWGRSSTGLGGGEGVVVGGRTGGAGGSRSREGGKRKGEKDEDIWSVGGKGARGGRWLHARRGSKDEKSLMLAKVCAS